MLCGFPESIVAPYGSSHVHFALALHTAPNGLPQVLGIVRAQATRRVLAFQVLRIGVCVRHYSTPSDQLTRLKAHVLELDPAE